MIPANSFLKDVRAKRKKVELTEKNCLNSTFFYFSLTSFTKKLTGIKDFAYFVTFVTIVIKLNLAKFVIDNLKNYIVKSFFLFKII